MKIPETSLLAQTVQTGMRPQATILTESDRCPEPLFGLFLKIVKPYPGRRLLNYGSGDGTFLVPGGSCATNRRIGFQIPKNTLSLLEILRG